MSIYAQEIEKNEARNLSDELLKSIVEAMGQVIPLPLRTVPPQAGDGSEREGEWGVLIGVTGDIYGRIVIVGDEAVFGKLGESMFGMSLDGDMLHSFVGELANMIAGHAATLVGGKGIRIDITPPTVMSGQIQLYGLRSVVKVPVAIEHAGDLHLIISRDSEGKV